MTMAEAPLLRVRGLRVEFAGRGGLFGFGTGRRGHEPRVAVDDVSFEIARGEALGVVGESGSGKSTLARGVLRLIPVTSGEVMLRGIDVRRSSGKELRRVRRAMQMVFQDPGSSLNPRLRVGSMLVEAMMVQKIVATRADARREAARLLERCGMESNALDRYPHEFSGGQRQRIAIARALSVRPELVVCDEPTSALDVSVQATILNLMQELQRDLGLSYLFISHDLGVVQHMCARIAVMSAGRIVEIGSRDQILDRPSQAYTRTLIEASFAGLAGVRESTRQEDRT